jgi:hypothetical protein
VAGRVAGGAIGAAFTIEQSTLATIINRQAVIRW